MFGSAVEDVFAVSLVREGSAFDGEVDGFGAAAGEDDIVGRFGMKEGGELLAGFCKGIARDEPFGVEGGWVAEMFAEERAHRRRGFGKERGSGLVIEVNACHSLGQGAMESHK